MNCLNSVAEDVKLGEGVRLSKFINLYGCEIGDETKIGAFVEIQKNAKIGRRCKISSHTFICEGVSIEDGVFIGHGVKFTNDVYPRATAADGELQTEADWKVEMTVVRRGASIGTGATILPNVEIGENAIVGAGSTVTKDVPAYAVVAGNPAKILRFIEKPQGGADLSLSAPIPFLDLVAPHRELEAELVDAFRRSLRTAGFVGGAQVEEFESAFASFCDAEHSVAVSSGTDALRFAIMACGIQPGDVVVTVPNTFIATTEAISQAHSIPEFIDVDEQTSNMSPILLQRYLERQCIRDKNGRLLSLRSGRPVTAVIPVHLYGQTADMDPILALADQYGLTVIEDACQAHGAEYFSKKLNRWLKAGTMGRAAAFSFYPGKNLGACGEGGAVTTNDATIAQKIRMIRDHGQAKKYHHDLEGYNGRLDAIQAGILRIKLSYLDRWNAQRRECAARYGSLLADNRALQVPHEPTWSRGVYHLYVIRVTDRDALIQHLTAAKIGVGIHYPVPLHLQKAYNFLNYALGDFPVSERLATEIISIPMFAHMSHAQQAAVSKEIRAFTSGTHSQSTVGGEEVSDSVGQASATTYNSLELAR